TMPMLEELVIGEVGLDRPVLRFTHAGDIWPLFAVAPALRRLVVRAGDLRVTHPPEHAALRELRVTTQLEPAERVHPAHATFPSLEVLDLAGEPLQLRARDVRGIANNPSFGKLRELSLRGTSGTQTVLNALVASPLASRLAKLSLFHGD